MIILGINAGHGASAALMLNGKLKFVYQLMKYRDLPLHFLFHFYLSQLHPYILLLNKYYQLY